MTTLVIRIVGWVWLAAAVFVGQQQLLARLPAAAVPLCVFGLSGLLLLAYFRVAAFRAWVDALDMRHIALLHVTRFVGFYFLFLYQRGVLPYAFAVPGGIGDILVAALALPLVFAPINEAKRMRAFTIWNVVGLMDILLVVLTAARINLADPFQMRALTVLPLSLLPTFLVPLIIATHVVLFVRLAQARRDS